MKRIKNINVQLSEYQAALNAAPNSPYADLVQMTIGEIYVDMQDHAQALATYEKVFKNYPNSVWRDALQYNTAVAHYKGGSSVEAKKVLQTLIDQYPASVFVACARQNVQSIERGQLPIFLTDTLQDDVERMIDQVKLDLVARAGGSFYSRAKNTFFEIPKPIQTKGIGVAALSDDIKNSKIFFTAWRI